MKRPITFLSVLSHLCLAAALFTAALALLGHWAINAEALGAQDFGIALFSTIVSAIALYGATWAAPVLLLAGAIGLRFERAAGLRLLTAGGLCLLPLGVLSLVT
jgi:hypothetical protein